MKLNLLRLINWFWGDRVMIYMYREHHGIVVLCTEIHYIYTKRV